MDLSDSAAVQRIWQRVGLTPQPGTPSATPSAPSITPGTPDALPDCLPQWIAAEQVSCRRCQAMARCAGAQEAKTLCCLARRSADHVRQLQAVYYVLTGQCCCPDAAPTDSLCCGPAQLRQTIQAAQAALSGISPAYWWSLWRCILPPCPGQSSADGRSSAAFGTGRTCKIALEKAAMPEYNRPAFFCAAQASAQKEKSYHKRMLLWIT